MASRSDTRQSAWCYRFPVSWRLGSVARRRLFIGAVVGLGLILWWWPGLTGSGQRPEVTVIGSGEIDETRQDLSRRLREAGLSVDWVTGVRTWCDVAATVDQRPSVTLVLSPEDFQPCAEPVERILAETFDRSVAERTVIVTFTSSREVVALLAGGARQVPIDRLIGDPGERVPCVWWEDCPVSGDVITRDAGGLTPEGLQRLARLITAQVV